MKRNEQEAYFPNLVPTAKIHLATHVDSTTTRLVLKKEYMQLNTRQTKETDEKLASIGLEFFENIVYLTVFFPSHRTMHFDKVIYRNHVLRTEIKKELQTKSCQLNFTNPSDKYLTFSEKRKQKKRKTSRK